VGLVHDHGPVVVWRELPKPLRTHERLHRADRDAFPFAQARALRFLQGTCQACRLLHLVRSLVKQFAAVGQDQHPATTADYLLGHGAKHNGLARARREHQERPPASRVPLAKDSRAGFLLVRSQLHVKSPHQLVVLPLEEVV